MTPQKLSRLAQIGAVVASGLLLAIIMFPFAEALFLAAIFAGALSPWSERLAARLRGRRSLAAGIITAAVVLLVLVPMALLGTVLIREVLDGVRFVRGVIEDRQMEGLIEYLPAFVRDPATELTSGVRDQLKDILASIPAGKAAAAVRSLVAATSGALFQIALMVVGMFFLLVEGRKLVLWARDVSPLPVGQLDELLREFRSVSKAVLLSSLVTAVVQATVAFIGYLITGVPHAVFFGVVTLVAAFIPVGGASLVGILLAIFLFATGHPWAGGVLLAWSAVIVGLVDNIVKPWVMKTGVDLHGAVIFFALLGGLTVFGFTGLLAGPLIVAFFLAMLRMNRGMLSGATASRPA